MEKGTRDIQLTHQAESLSVSLFHNTTRIVFLVLQVSRAADKNNAGQGAYLVSIKQSRNVTE
jgi:hypothetical protein